MRLIIRTTTNNMHGENGDCDFAVVDITPELAKLIAKRRKMALEVQKQDDAVRCLHFEGPEVGYHTAEYCDWEDGEGYAYPEPFAQLVGQVQAGEDFIEIPDGMDLGFLLFTEEGEHLSFKGLSDVMVICPNEFGWTKYIEDLEIETLLISYDVLSKLI